MTTLLQQLRPEVAQALEKNRDKYDYSVTELYNNLDTKHLYSELTIAEMRDLTLYADVSFGIGIVLILDLEQNYSKIK